MTYFIVYKQGGSKAPADISSMHEYYRGLLLPARLEVVGTWASVDLRRSAGIRDLHAHHGSRSSHWALTTVRNGPHLTWTSPTAINQDSSFLVCSISAACSSDGVLIRSRVDLLYKRTPWHYRRSWCIIGVPTFYRKCQTNV